MFFVRGAESREWREFRQDKRRQGERNQVEEIRTTLFGKSFGDLVKSSIEIINDIEKKAKAKKRTLVSLEKQIESN